MTDLLLQQTLSSDEEDNKELKEAKDSDKDSSDEEDNEEMNSDFEFGGFLGEDDDDDKYKQTSKLVQGWSLKSALDILASNDRQDGVPERMNVENIVAAERSNIIKKKKEQKEKGSSDEDEDENDSSDEDGDSDSDDSTSSDEDAIDDDVEVANKMDSDVLKERNGDKNKKQKEDTITEIEDEEKLEAEKAAKYFDSKNNSNKNEIEVFSQLNLSRPLLRGVASMGFVTPTPIQASCIPAALAGRDVCASAVTGSGKTAAFLLPIMERIMQRTTRRVNEGVTKCLVLTPTRELAAQCLGMFQAIGRYTELSGTLVVGGGRNVTAQAAALRSRPDVVIGTPGRLLDHITNSTGVHFDDVDFLVLDEADRLLDMGFFDEVMEIVKVVSPSRRQTLLFSATMNTKIDDLIKLSLKRPLRIAVSTKDTKGQQDDVEVAPRLIQEFIRIRPSQEKYREAILLSLLSRTFKQRVIVFFDTKIAAHRFYILLGLCGIKSREIHGNLTQTQRLEALECFRLEEVDMLIATDVAARGLDINGVETIINFEMPTRVENYVHRIGRTARAGRKGRSCTLITEGRRTYMKKVIKDAQEKQSNANAPLIQSRVVPPNVIRHFDNKILSLEVHIEQVLSAEHVAKIDRLAQMEVTKAENMITHRHEIMSRPAKVWPVNKSKLTLEESKPTKKVSEPGTGQHNMTRKKRRARAAQAELKRFEQEERDNQEEEGGNDYVPVKSKQPKEKRIKKLSEEDPITNFEKMAKKRKKKAKTTMEDYNEDTVGDGSLFSDDKVTFSNKQKGERTNTSSTIKSSYEFRGYDPSMKFGKGGHKGHHKFKSKSKFKRKKK